MRIVENDVCVLVGAVIFGLALLAVIHQRDNLVTQDPVRSITGSTVWKGPGYPGEQVAASAQPFRLLQRPFPERAFLRQRARQPGDRRQARRQAPRVPKGAAPAGGSVQCALSDLVTAARLLTFMPMVCDDHPACRIRIPESASIKSWRSLIGFTRSYLSEMRPSSSSGVDPPQTGTDGGGWCSESERRGSKGRRGVYGMQWKGRVWRFLFFAGRKLQLRDQEMNGNSGLPRR